MDDLKTSILLYIHHFTSYDYVAFGWLFVIFFLFLFLAILLVRKSTKISFLLIFLALVLALVGPFALKSMLDGAIRPVKVKDINVQQLHFSHTLILDWNIQNLSKIPLKDCKSTITIKKYEDSIWSQLTHPSTPLLQKTFYTTNLMNPDEIVKNRRVFNDFNNNDDINISNVSIKTECY